MIQNLTGRTALVTGSGRGIGSAIALELARLGADLTIHCAGDIERAAEISRTISEHGGHSRVVQTDLSRPEGADLLMQEIDAVDILVLNASVQFRSPWEQISREAFETQLNCNVWSSLRLAQLAVPHMKENKWGRIISLGSVQENRANLEMLIYAASKAAQTNLIRSLARELAPYGITANNIAPGVILTDRNTAALSDSEYAGKMLRGIPAGYFGEKEDCIGIVSLLCSDAGRYITGQSIYVDGGMSL